MNAGEGDLAFGAGTFSGEGERLTDGGVQTSPGES